MTVDPLTGKYVPVKDPFLTGSPEAGNNPNRLSNSVSRRQGAMSGVKSGGAGKPADVDVGKTAAQRAASDPTKNGSGEASQKVRNSQAKAGSAYASSANVGDAFASVPGFAPDDAVGLGDMTVYQAPSSPKAQNPFALPDWWPSGQDAGVPVQSPNP